jgi:hypothetical protein
MIQIYQNPTLLDFIKVCFNLPQDERDQLEAFTGEPYDIDSAAVGNFMTPGPKWVAKVDEEPISIGGFVPLRPGVWQDFMLNTPEAFAKKNWFALTRASRRCMNAVFSSRQGHRIECIVPGQRLMERPELEAWYKVLGYNREATLYGYCATGADAIIFSRVQH